MVDVAKLEKPKTTWRVFDYIPGSDQERTSRVSIDLRECDHHHLVELYAVCF